MINIAGLLIEIASIGFFFYWKRKKQIDSFVFVLSLWTLIFATIATVLSMMPIDKSVANFVNILSHIGLILWSVYLLFGHRIGLHTRFYPKWVKSVIWILLVVEIAGLVALVTNVR